MYTPLIKVLILLCAGFSLCSPYLSNAQYVHGNEICILNLDTTKWELIGSEVSKTSIVKEYALRSEIRGKYTRLIKLMITSISLTPNITPDKLYVRNTKNLDRECPGITDSEILSKGSKAIIYKTRFREKCNLQKAGLVITRLRIGSQTQFGNNLYEISYSFIGIEPDPEMVIKAGETLAGARLWIK